MSDSVNHPSHYTAYKGLEVIDLTEQLNFNKGNAVKYIARAGLKDPGTEIEDLDKARWYIEREIQRLRQNETVDGLQTSIGMTNTYHKELGEEKRAEIRAKFAVTCYTTGHIFELRSDGRYICVLCGANSDLKRSNYIVREL